MSSLASGTVAKPAMSAPASSMTGIDRQSRTIPEYSGPADEYAEVLDQNTFSKMLSFERKRTERSGRRFVLMLLESDKLIRTQDRQLAFDTLIRALSRSTRQTDIKGWYKQDSRFGIIFTEVGNGERQQIAKALLNKVTGALSSTLGIDEINEIRLCFRSYPEDTTECGDDGPPDLTLYPDRTARANRKWPSCFVKRVMDIVGSLLALILLSPWLAAIALAVKLTSSGPVLFRQKRVGQYCDTFTFLKFRSMYRASDETIHKEFVTRFISGRLEGDGAAVSKPLSFKLKNDPRITPIGRLLRRTSLDELPQLVNVLRGEMSLVGPRPPIPYEFACYQAWHKSRLMIVKPGITGLWQVSGRSKVKFNDMVRLDLKYANTWTVWLDMKILLKTPTAVLSGEGAY